MSSLLASLLGLVDFEGLRVVDEKVERGELVVAVACADVEGAVEADVVAVLNGVGLALGCRARRRGSGSRQSAWEWRQTGRNRGLGESSEDSELSEGSEG